MLIFLCRESAKGFLIDEMKKKHKIDSQNPYNFSLDFPCHSSQHKLIASEAHLFPIKQGNREAKWFGQMIYKLAHKWSKYVITEM